MSAHVVNALLPVAWSARRAATAPGTSLGALADALARELEPLVADSSRLPIPSQKATLTRHGGRCPVHGTYLVFDPFAPHTHQCVACGAAYTGRDHDDWWAMGAQLWTAERAVHAAALFALRGDPRHRALSETILHELAARYLTYPNRDNTLGPARPFFSTYLESIWLLNVCQALALLEPHGAMSVGGAVRSSLIEPSRALITSYDEGVSNRQVWNSVAVAAASTLLDDPSALRHELFGPRRLQWMLETLTDADGAWYEGENYHLFAHRGFWYARQLLAAQGYAVDGVWGERFQRGFRFPFTGLLPDDCLPSRRDTAYAISIRQWRLAEYLELGYALHPDPALAGLLTRVYDGRVTRRSDARARSMADAERNEPPMHLTRADLSWRALLCAAADPAPATPWMPTSALRSTEGLSVIRREEARVFVGLEGGGDPRHHGHPDTLALTLQADTTRWLQDPGAGSYVDPSLAWYRSTLAHHAPLVNGRTQEARAVEVLNFEDRGGAGWMRKRLTLAGDVVLTRSVVVADGYVIDALEWEAPAAVTVTLPLAATLSRDDIAGVTAWTRADLATTIGTLDGAPFLTEAYGAGLVGDALRVQLSPHEAARPTARAWYASSVGGRLIHAEAPGVPGAPRTTRLLLTAGAPRGQIIGVWSWGEHATAPPVTDVVLAPGTTTPAIVTTHDGTRAEHGPAPHGWHIGLVAAHARSSIDLEGEVGTRVVWEDDPLGTPIAPRSDEVHELPRLPDTVALSDPLPDAWTRVLGADAYVRTEEPYAGGNTPTAQVEIGATSAALLVRVTVHTGHPVVHPGGAVDAAPENPLDNEPADVNADGVQWHAAWPEALAWSAGELLIPLAEGVCRRTRIVEGPDDGVPPPILSTPRVEVQVTPTGWTMQLVFDRTHLPAGTELLFHLTVNERPAARMRRRGQLRLAGGGFWRYIAGPREQLASSRVRFRLP